MYSQHTGVVLYLKIIVVFSFNTKTASGKQSDQSPIYITGPNGSFIEQDLGNSVSGSSSPSIEATLDKRKFKFAKHDIDFKLNLTNLSLSKQNQKINNGSGVVEDKKQHSFPLNDKPYEEDFGFQEKKREDGFVMTTPKDSPYSVLLLGLSNGDRTSICTGTLLTDEWILTAAHCIKNPMFSIEKIRIYAGGNSFNEVSKNKPADGSQTRTSSTFYHHPKYKKHKFDYDIGLVKVDEKFILMDTVNVMNLSVNPWSYHGYYNCVFTGFGRIQLDQSNSGEEERKRKTHFLQVKKPCICSFRLKMLLHARKMNRWICARPIEDYGVCVGDSGGGLICDGQVKGVASQIVQLGEMQTCSVSLFKSLKCGSATTLSVFQDVCPLLRWINGHVDMYDKKDIHPDCVDTGGSGNIKQDFVALCPLILIILITLPKYTS